MLQEEKSKALDIQRILTVFISKWYIILLSVAIALLFTFVKLRYTSSLYTASIDLKIDDERGGQISDFFKYGRVSGRIENILRTESEIIKSRSMSIKTLKKLDYYFKYTINGKILSTQLYPNDLFRINPIYLDSSDLGKSFTFKLIDPKRFEIVVQDSKHTTIASDQDTFTLDKSILSIKLLNPKLYAIYKDQPINVTINDLTRTAIGFCNSIDVEIGKGTSILTISFTSDESTLSSDFVNTLADVYINDQVDIKSLAAEQTLLFIEKQLNQLSSNVQESQQKLAQFKSQNKGVELEELAKADFQHLTDLEASRNITEIKRRLVENSIKRIEATKSFSMDFAVFDIEDATTFNDLQKLYNELIVERLTLSEQNTTVSPTMIENERKIKEVKKALINALNSTLEKIQDQLSQFNELITEKTDELKGLPNKQQELINIQRNYNVNEKIFSYLLEKRLETLISKASITSNASIIDRSLSGQKIYPNENKNYTFAMMIALIFSTGVIWGMRSIYNKVPDKETIEELSQTPVIGIIKKIDIEELANEYSIYTLHSPKSIFSESIRSIRTNINFLTHGEKHKIVSLTSTVSGEGKTFCTMNLAASLTLLGHKVIILGCDLRRPKIHLSFKNIDNRTGITSYLIGKNTLEEIIKETEYKNLYVIPAGPIPPNPSELLQTPKMLDLLNELKSTYDYVFLDTAPVGLVSDSFSLLKLSDINLFIIRAQYSKRNFALIPDRLVSDNEIPNLYIILNSYDHSGRFYSSLYKNEYGGYYGGGGYYYGSGYGYYKSAYTSGYYTDEELKNKSNLFKKLSKPFKKK